MRPFIDGTSKKKKKKKEKASTFPDLRLFPNLRSNPRLRAYTHNTARHFPSTSPSTLPPLTLLPETTWNHAVQQIRFHLSNLTEYCISMYASISSVIVHRVFDRYPPIWTVIEARQHRGMGGERGKSVNLDIFQFILFQGNERAESWKSRSLYVFQFSSLSQSLKLELVIFVKSVEFNLHSLPLHF